MDDGDYIVLRKRFADSRQRCRVLKQIMREQKDRARKIVTAFATKLQEKDDQIQSILENRDRDLTFITQELTLLQANLLKEQTKLRQTILDKNQRLENQEQELKELRKQNKKLLLSTRAKMLIEDRDMDTPSSEENSPKSSFSKNSSKGEIKSRHVNTKLFINGDHVKTGNGALAQNLISSGNGDNSGTPPELLPKASHPVKPPVPSRAGVNRKLQSLSVSSERLAVADLAEVPPVPPVRTTSIQNSTGGKEDRFDSGRESDATDAESSLNLNSRHDHGDIRVISVCNKIDEGFSSSHEDPSKQSAPSIRQMTNHRAVQKPSDIKFRSKLRSCTIPPSTSTISNDTSKSLSPTGDSVEDVTSSVSYWSEPYV